MRHTRPQIGGVATSVRSTAVLTAAARALETEREDALIRDPLAALLIEPPELADLVDKATALSQRVPELAAAHRQMTDYQVARARYFDDYIADAIAAGLRQVVIMAAGLDTRAFRLPFPDGVTIYEVDRPKALLYKAATLARNGVRPGADWRPVGVEADGSWATTLWKARFNHNEPTAWLAEGLLPLPDAAQDALITEVDGLSAAGSRLALDESIGYAAGFCHPADWLTSRGWWTTTTDADAYLARLSRPVGNQGDELLPLRATFVTAEKVA